MSTLFGDPPKGGELWVELSPGDRVRAEIMEHEDEQGQRRYGQVLPDSTNAEGHVYSVFPSKATSSLPWKDTRTVLIAYTPESLGKLDHAAVHQLEEHNFPVPISQMPEYYVGDLPVMNKVEHHVDHGEGDYGLGPFMEQTASDIVDSEIEEWDMYLELNNGMVKIGDESGSSIDAQPMLSKVEVCYARGIEKILSELRGPLEVTYTVDPREVLPGSDTKAEWLHRKGAQRLPTKFVFTIKPGDSPQPWPATYVVQAEGKAGGVWQFRRCRRLQLVFGSSSIRICPNGTSAFEKEEMDGGLD